MTSFLFQVKTTTTVLMGMKTMWRWVNENPAKRWRGVEARHSNWHTDWLASWLENGVASGK